jgi:hypothetical protein
MKKKVLGAIILLLIGFSLGTVTTNNAKADSNVVLASVEWVLSKFTPIEDKVNQLEQRVTNLENGETPPVFYSAVVVNKATPAYKGASTSYSSFFTAPAGLVFSYNSTYKNSVTGETWYIVKFSDGRLAAVKSADTSLLSTAPTSISKVFITNTAAVKRGAAASYETIYTASTGETLVYNSTYTNSVTGEKWYIVKTPSGKYGAVLATFAEVIK